MGKDPPLVTVAIPAYNHARYLDQAVRSVLAQDYPQVELIVLDDGSTDGTSAVLERYGNRFRWETHANMGQAATLNKGWGMARGDILGYLSADDVLAPQAARKAVAALMENPRAVAAYPDFNLIDPHSAVVRTVRAPDFDFCRALLGNECLPGPGAFFRKETLRKASGWNPALKQMPDYDFWLRLGLHGEFIHLREALANFRVHPGSQTYGAATPERADEPVAIISAILANALLPEAATPLRESALANAHLFSAQLHLRAGRVLEGWRRICAAYRLQPRRVVSARFGRLLANAVFNRIGHRALWSARALFRRNGAPRS